MAEPAAVPVYPPPKIDVTKATLAFGPRQIPKLKEELVESDDLVVIQRALRSLMDISVSIQRMEELVAAHIQEALIPLIKHEDDATRLLTAKIYETLSVHAPAREQFLSSGAATVMATLFQDSFYKVRIAAYNTVLNLCCNAPGARAVVDEGMIPALVTHLGKEKETVQKIILDILHFCSPVNPQLILSCGGLATAVPLLSCDFGVLRAKATRLVMELCNSPEGKEEACTMELCPRLVTLLSDVDGDVRGMAAGALMVIGVTTKGKHCVAEAGALEPLLKLIDPSEGTTTVLYSLKALTCLAEVPSCRADLVEHLEKFQPLKRHPSRAVVSSTDIAIRVITWVA